MEPSLTKSFRVFSLFLDRNHWLSAFDRVKENHGCAGTDGVSIEQFEENIHDELKRLAREIDEQAYRPWPLLEIEVEEVIRDGERGEILKQKRRRLKIPTVRDRVAQTAILQIVEPWIDAQLEASSFGYRKGRGVRDALNEIRKWCSRGFRWVVDADIDDFFDHVDHDLLLEKLRPSIELPLRVEIVKKNSPRTNNTLQQEANQLLRSLVGLFTQWIQAEVWDGKRVDRLTLGIPQGSVVSPMLANLFLDELDEHLLAQDYKLVRYADDFVILCKNAKQAEEAFQLTETKLHQLHLKLNRDKTRTVRFEDSFKFLGALFWKDLVLLPYSNRIRERKVISFPPPLPEELAGEYRASEKRRAAARAVSANHS